MNRCAHGVYKPDGDVIALSCTLCNPAGIAGGEIPQFNRRHALKLTQTGQLPKCPTCKIPVLVSNDGVCTGCNTQFEIEVANLRANNKQAGICESCGSKVHYTLSRRQWKCADCGHKYDAPKRVRCAD